MKKNSQRKKITIRDVADLVGVHHSTVSRALNPQMKEKISPEMIRKVNKAAEKLGYYPNIVASSLKQNRSFTIGVLIPDLMNPVFPPIIRGIQDTAENAGYTILTANTDDDEDKELQALRRMQGRAIDGVIVATAHRQDPIVQECVKHHIPFVMVNRTVDGGQANAVVLDEDYGIRAAVDHLASLNHQSIAHVAGPQNSSTGFERANAFASCLRARQMDPGMVEYAQKFTVDEGYRCFKKLLGKYDGFTAVIAANDLIALGCLDAMDELGLTCPDDISVVSYNDIRFLQRMTPGLTTLRIPKYEMGVQAVKMLLDNLGKEDETEPLILKMQPSLVVRASTSTPRNQSQEA